MIVTIGHLFFKPGMETKGLDVLLENSALGAEQKGCLEATVMQNIDDASDILIVSKWQDEVSYTNAKANLKRDPTARKLFLKVLPYFNKQPHYDTYRVLS